MVVPSFVFAPMFVFLASFGGVGNETLDFVDSTTYWKLAGVGESAEYLIPIATGEVRAAPDSEILEQLVSDLSSSDFVTRQRAMSALAEAGAQARPILEKARLSADPQVATSAAQVLPRLSDSSGGNRLHQLMAIRTLGEKKVASAATHLEKLTGSKRPFVAQYARRALAALRGEKFRPDEPDPLTFQKDLAIVYPSVAAVYHARSAPRTGGIKIREHIGEAKAIAVAEAALGTSKLKKLPPEEELLERMTGEHLRIFQRIGNVRIDSFTAVIPTGFTPDDGGIVVVVRGLCDYESSRRFMEEEFPKIAPEGASTDKGLKVIRVGEIDWIHQRVMETEFYVHFPHCGELLIFVGGTDSPKYLESVSRRLAGKDKTPVTGPGIDLIKNIPGGATSFFAGKIPESAEAAARDALGFQTVSGSMRPTAGGKLTLRLLAGGEPDRLQGWQTQLRAGFGLAAGALRHLAVGDTRLTRLSEMADSLKVTAGEKSLDGELQIPQGLPLSLLIRFSGSWIAPDVWQKHAP